MCTTIRAGPKPYRLNADVNFLREIAVRAKWDGSFTEEWAAIKTLISREGALGNAPGKSDIQKLQHWAKTQGLLMDFEVDYEGFSSQIRTVTFWNDAGQAAAENGTIDSSAINESLSADLPDSTPVPPAGQAAVPGAQAEYFDWDAVGCR